MPGRFTRERSRLTLSLVVYRSRVHAEETCVYLPYTLNILPELRAPWRVAGGVLPSRLRIGCVFGSRNGMFCRVLHTQLLEVVEFVVSEETLKICWAFASVRVRLPLPAPCFPAVSPLAQVS